MRWLGLGRSRVSDMSDEPVSQSDDAYSIFFNCFFLPMLADGRLDSEEFTPLEAAYFGLNVDNTPFELVRNRLLSQVETIRHQGLPAQDASFCPTLLDAWQRKIDHSTGLPRITENQREELFKWVRATIQRYASDLELTLRDREEQKFGGDGDGTVRDDKRYKSHLKRFGVGHKKPTRAESDQVAKLIREIAALLKSVSDGAAPCTADVKSSEDLHPKQQSPSPSRTSEVVDASRGDPSSPPAGTLAVDATTAAQASASGSATPPPRASTSQNASDASSLTPTASADGAPKASAPPLPDPPTVIDSDMAALLRDQPNAVADRLAALSGKSKEICEALSCAFGDFSALQQSPLAFSQHRTSAKGQVVIVPEADAVEATPLWFLGDIHGDILALDAAVQYIDSLAAEATIVFLGDLFDDRGFGYEVVLRVFELIVTRPGRIGYIVGNHDIALGMRTDPDLVFSSSVSPSDFAEFLNDRRDNDVISAIGKLLVHFFQTAPRAMFLPDGLIAAHAGVPLGIRWQNIKSVADLERDECLQDFTWTRAHERARKKIPNPSSKTSEFGFEDFSAFCDFVSATLGVKAERIVRGHDHYEAGYSLYPKWVRNQCVTINTMSRRLPRDPFGTFHRTPCVARWVPGKAPEVHRLAIPGNLIDAYYKPETNTDGESSAAAAGTS